MSLDDLIKDSLQDATDVNPPEPDLGRIHRRGAHRTAVRVGAAALATLCMVAGGTYVIGQIADDATERHLPASLLHQDPNLGYAAGNTVHLGDVAYRPENGGPDAVRQGVVTDDGFVYLGRDAVPYLIDSEGEETALAESTEVRSVPDWSSSLRASEDGRYVAWQSNAGGDFVIELYDTEADAVTHTKSIDLSTLRSDADVRAGESGWITSVRDGVVYFQVIVESAELGGSATLRTAAWDVSEDRVYPVTQRGSSVVAVEQNTVVVSGSGEVRGPDGSRLDSDWNVVRIRGDYSSGESTYLTGDGEWLLRHTANAISATNLRTDERVDVDVPVSAKRPVTDVVSDDDGSLLVTTTRGWTKRGGGQRDALLWDCDLAARKCIKVQEHLAGTDRVEARFPTGSPDHP